MGVDEHKKSIPIKLAFAFFSLQRRVRVRFGERFILLEVLMSTCLFSKYFLCAEHWGAVLQGCGGTLVRKRRQKPGPTKYRI